MPGDVVDVLVARDRLAAPGGAAVVATQQARDLGRREHPLARDVRVARRAGTRRVRQVPLLAAREARDAPELVPAPPAVRAAVDPRRLRAGEVGGEEAQRRWRALDPIPRPALVGAPEQA